MQTGQARLDKYFKQLKRKLNNNDTINNYPNKKIKIDTNSIQRYNQSEVTLSIQDNLNEISIKKPSPTPIKQVIKPEKEKKKIHDNDNEHHPIYDITNFPSIKLPQIINPEKTLMPQPIWMKKGQKIISDISNEINNENKKEKLKDDESSNNHSLNSLRLDYRLINTLKSEGYKLYFPVQKNVIPAIIRGIIQKRDIAVCAPTGSGKTLAYVLPICHVLSQKLSSTNHYLRGLIVSPSRDLALQLFLVFDKFAKSVGIKVGLSAGQKSLKDEEYIISNIDILICTPGRLIDHLNHTQTFDISYLEFIVLDEADRLLLTQSYQDWLFRVYYILQCRKLIEKSKFNVKNRSKINNKIIKYKNKICLTSRKSSHEKSNYLLKILVSATLTHNPKIISSLKLNNPLYFGSSTNKQYLIPSSIQQYYICCFAGDKLCNLISLIDILRQENKTAVCFCQTVEIAHRLKRLLEITFNKVHKLDSFKVAEFSRMVPDRQRPHILRKFRGKKIDFLICSDAMSRGLDIPYLDFVINYELPKNIETYVHRIGRTARGIGKGQALTIIMNKEKKIFNNMLKSVENGDKLKQYEIKMKVIRFHRKYMNKYTDLLNKILLQEINGDLDHNDKI